MALDRDADDIPLLVNHFLKRLVERLREEIPRQHFDVAPLSVIGPLSGGPPFDLVRLGPDVAGLRPAGFLWLGLLAVIATPTARVIASLVGYTRGGERSMAIVAALILVVIAASVGLARALEA